MHLFEMPSVDVPFRYFGAKTKAREVLSRHVPNDVKEVVSPFLGGGAFELYLTARGIQVHGYDICEPLVTLWEQLLTSPLELSEKVREHVAVLTPESWLDYQATEYSSGLECAAQALITLNLTFLYIGFRNGSATNFWVTDDGVPFYAHPNLKGRKLISYERIASFQNSMISVERLDFRESLARHPDVFAYCDPPYPDAGSVYGTEAEHHEAFPHAELAEILHGRDNWVLSYNNSETIQKLYPKSKFDWHYPKWRQSGKRHDLQGNEVIITPRH